LPQPTGIEIALRGALRTADADQLSDTRSLAQFRCHLNRVGLMHHHRTHGECISLQ
jgi:hypothetical protein